MPILKPPVEDLQTFTGLDSRVDVVEEAPLSLADPRFNAYLDGVTDDSTDLNDAVNLVSTAGGGRVLIPRTSNGVYIGAGATLKSNVTLMGEGVNASSLLLSDAATDGLTINPSWSNTASTLLTANLTRGSFTATVTSVSGISTGDLVLFAGNSIDLGYWVSKVASISVLTLTLEDPSPIAITTAQVATCYRFSVVRNVGIRDLEIRTNTSSPTLRKYVMTAYRAEDVILENVRFKNATAVGASGIYASIGRNFTLKNCVAENILATNTAVGLNIEGITGTIIDHCRTRNVSTGLSLSGCPKSNISGGVYIGLSTSGGRGIKVLANSNHTTINGTSISGFAATHTGLYCLDSSFCTFTGNTISDVGDGIVMGGNLADAMHHNTIANNVMLNCGIYGIWCSLTPAGFDAWCNISNNIIKEVLQNSIQVGVSSSMIVGNQCENWVGFGLRIPASNIKNHIGHNHFKDNGGGASAAILTTTAGNFNAGNNTVDTTETITIA